MDVHGKPSQALRWPVSAILLAAGRSRRMAGRNKLLMPWQGEPLVRLLAGRFVHLPFLEVLLVTGYQAEEVSRAVAELPVKIVHNPHYEEGMAASLRAGIAAASQQAEGLLICPSDLPLLTQEIIRQLVRAFLAAEGEKIVFPQTTDGQRNPVIFPARLKPELLRLRGDLGARGVIFQHTQALLPVPFADPRPFCDVDTPEMWQALGEEG